MLTRPLIAGLNLYGGACKTKVLRELTVMTQARLMESITLLVSPHTELRGLTANNHVKDRRIGHHEDWPDNNAKHRLFRSAGV